MGADCCTGGGVLALSSESGAGAIVAAGVTPGAGDALIAGVGEGGVWGEGDPAVVLGTDGAEDVPADGTGLSGDGVGLDRDIHIRSGVRRRWNLPRDIAHGQR